MTQSVPCRRRSTPGGSLTTTVWLLLAVFRFLGVNGDFPKYNLRQREETSTMAHRRMQETNTSNEDVYSDIRVRISPFKVLLKGTLVKLEPTALNDLLRRTENLLFTHIETKDMPADASLKYVLLSSITSTFNDDADESTLQLAAGVIALDTTDASKTPSVAAVNDWVREAIDTKMADSLQGTPYYYVTEATYVVEEGPTIVGGLERGEASPGEGNDSKVGVIVGSICAACACVVLLVLFVKRRRNVDKVLEVKPRKGHDDKTAANESFDRDLSPMKTSVPIENNETKSVAGSESDWTVNTEAGDSAALKSIPHGSQVLVAVPSSVSTESFERDRPINLRKDMLTSAWSGRMPSRQNNQQESVLQPSHFLASDERRNRNDDDEYAGPEEVWDDEGLEEGERSGSPFLFEKANAQGEEILLMPPSQARQGRGSGELL